MTNALTGKRSVALIFIAPDEKAAEVMREFFKAHFDFMQAKSYQEGPLKLIAYQISESPEYEKDVCWTEGKYPKETGRTAFHLYEIYETEEGLHHHWIESSEYVLETFEIVKTYGIEFHLLNQMKVIQSLWD